MYFDGKKFDNSLRQALMLRLECGLGIDSKGLDEFLSCQKFEKIHIFRNPKNAPIGYLLYGRISKYTLGLLNKYPEHLLKPYEYNEGRLFYLLDVCFLPDDRILGLKLLKEHLLKEKIIVSSRYNRLSLYRKNKGTFKKVRLIQSVNKDNEIKFSLLSKVSSLVRCVE